MKKSIVLIKATIMLEEAPQLIVMMSNYGRKAPELRQCNVDSIHVQAWKVDPLMCEYFKLLVKDIKGKAKESLRLNPEK